MSKAVKDMLEAPLPATRFERVVDTFANQVRRDPSALAVATPQLHVSYDRLAERVEEISERIRRLDLGAGDVVAVTGPRSINRVASMLAALGSGTVLLTIDPTLPAKRRQLMISEAGARGIVTVHDDFSAPSVDQLPSTAARLPADAAYIFFTSGTTSTPRAVVGTHNGLAHFLAWQRSTFRVNRRDRCAHLVGLSFDVVLRDVLLPLTSGASLHIPDTADATRPARTLSWLGEQRITLLHTVPASARAWLARGTFLASVPTLRCVFFAGEPLHGELVKAWRRATSRACEVVNLYGPTETTLAKCWYVVPDDPPPGLQPVGRPLPETEIAVVSADLTVCANGEIGEVVIRTPHRTLGYLNDPEAERHAFVPNPHVRDGRDVLYRTGDRGRLRETGELEILGRFDSQMKLRGVRFEATEVESVLAQDPAVGHCAVCLTEEPMSSSPEPVLTALVVPRTGFSVDAGRLRRRAASELPAMLLPSRVVAIDALPLTANGKLDRRALVDRAGGGTVLASDFSPVMTPTEEAVAALWKDVLDVEHVGATDDFFAVGGDSLAALRLVTQMRARFGCTLELAALLEFGTVRRLAAFLEEAAETPRHTARTSPLVALRATGTRTPLFFVHPIGGEVLCYRELANCLGDDQPFYALAAHAEEIVARRPSVEEIAAEYVRAIRAKRPAGPYLLGGISFGGTVAYEMARQLQADGHEVAFLALLDAAPTPAVPARPTTAQVVRNVLRPLPYFLFDHARFITPADNFRRVWRKAKFWGWRLERWTAGAPRGHAERQAKVLSMWFPPERAMVAAALAHASRAYKPGPYTGTVTLIQSRATVRPFDVEKPEEGWRRLTGENVRVHFVPGAHWNGTMLRKPVVNILAEILRACLDTGGEAELRSECVEQRNAATPGRHWASASERQ